MHGAATLPVVITGSVQSLADRVCAMSGPSLQQQEWAESVGSGEPFRLVRP